jgi:hypothetical protein
MLFSSPVGFASPSQNFEGDYGRLEARGADASDLQARAVPVFSYHDLGHPGSVGPIFRRLGKHILSQDSSQMSAK